jgi:hypothetical protein
VPNRRAAMSDLIFVGVTVVFFVATAFAIVAMEKV